MTGPYLSIKQAAEYCGGYAPDTIRRLFKRFSLPGYGPGGTRFRVADVDAWMENPKAFLAEKARQAMLKRRRPGSFTPV